MKKHIILVRGCAGAGKSTIAQLFSGFTVFSADDYFDKLGQYDRSKLKEAHRWCFNETENAMRFNLNVAVANTFTREWEMKEYFELADQYGYQISTIIVENRHGNKSVHNVPSDRVKAMADRFEIQLIPPTNYEDLVKVKTYSNGLSLHKYKSSVFYNNRWGEHPLLLDARGIVLDENGKIIQYPFTKIFNRFENGTNIPDEEMVTALEKINGFMSAVTLYNNEILVSTTGSLDSDFVKMAKEKLPMDTIVGELDDNISYCFEIVHENDPHIIVEKPGAYLIGGRRKFRNSPQLSVEFLKEKAARMGVMFPDYRICKFGDIVADAKKSKREGWVVYSQESDKSLKIKTPYYLVSKFIARKKDMSVMFSNNYRQHFDEEFYPLCEYLQKIYNGDLFMQISEQRRLEIIREYFNVQ
jgi:hypothetical protein